MSGSSLRTPTLSVIANGTVLQNVVDADVLDNAHFAAARFRLRLALDAATATTLLQAGSVIDIRLGLGGGTVSVLQGEADTVRCDVLNRLVELEGRDLTGRLLDARTQETFSNRTASEIAELLAERHGLTPEVTATTTLSGRYYDNEHDRITLGQFSRSTTEWDLLTFLAAREGFEAFVAGQTLFFGPLRSADTATVLTPADCLSLNLEQSLTLARDLQVTVASWNTRQQSAVRAAARSSGTGRRGGKPQRIAVVRPNLSADEAQRLANRILADLSAHERLVHAELPGELALTPRSRVTLSGTGTDFDQTYYVAELDRHFSAAHGYVERLRLKNIPPASTSG